VDVGEAATELFRARGIAADSRKSEKDEFPEERPMSVGKGTGEK